ncbi:hypothetical protein M404DRAFT_27197 [Pisolithus tinctorius Marx 270]|uniref:Uncharacterized protein n=1 Tax=Pisolithus tinctorius Marx 270 TaxID=870435 RepID=A0A0C3NQQ5_PISTI|nr:hypothetical protein M404DRAFT_27197 [Pisolithus tinctorius Marx 270]
MSNLRPTIMTNSNKGWVPIDWTQVSDNAIKYDTDDEEEAWHKEQAWLEAKRVVREKAEAERAEQEAEEKRAYEEERHKAKEEREAKWKCKAKAGKGDEAGARSNEASGEVKKVVMDPG